jgi:hypothetical protein
VEWPAGDLFEIRPQQATGPATLEIIPRPLAADVDATVPVRIVEEANAASPAEFTVRFRTFAAMPDAAPYGAVEGEGQPAALGPEVLTFQGWALDAFDLRRVWAEYAEADGSVVPVASATLTWMRPDVASIWPDAHDIYRSGWVLQLPPAALAGVRLPVVLRFHAENGAGQRAEIGRRTIVASGSR